MLPRIIIAIIFGAAIGGLLGHVGKSCQGSCPLTRTPLRGMIYGSVWGFLIGIISFYR